MRKLKHLKWLTVSCHSHLVDYQNRVHKCPWIHCTSLIWLQSPSLPVVYYCQDYCISACRFDVTNRSKIPGFNTIKSTACSCSSLKEEFLDQSSPKSLSSTHSRTQDLSSSEDTYNLHSSARLGSRIICGRIPLDRAYLYMTISNCKGSWEMKYNCVSERKKGNNKVVSATVNNASR